MPWKKRSSEEKKVSAKSLDIYSYVAYKNAWRCLEWLRKRAQTFQPCVLRNAAGVHSLFNHSEYSAQGTRHKTPAFATKHISPQCPHRKPFITSFNRTHVWREIWAIKYLVSIQVKVYRWHISIILNSNTGGRRFAKDVFHLRLHYRHSHAKQDSMHLMAPPS